MGRDLLFLIFVVMLAAPPVPRMALWCCRRLWSRLSKRLQKRLNPDPAYGNRVLRDHLDLVGKGFGKG